MVALKLTLVLSSLASLAANVVAVKTYGYSPKNGMPLPDLLYATIDDLKEGMAAGTFSAVDLTKAYLARIAEINPVLHAIIETNPDALTIAAELDAERANGTVRGPLHGIPIIVKDNIATDDKMNTTAGSFALLGAKVPRDSTMAAKLRAAGAIILAKANLSQWANYRSTNSTNGWTSRGGQTYGAYYPFMDPSGSSSGSGVSASIGLAAGTLGSETSGSIVGPTWRNSLSGIKPSVGLTSRSLVVPISQTQDTVGPICKTMMDSAYLLSAIAGPDPADNYTSAIPFSEVPDYAALCNTDGLKGARIGVPRDIISYMTSVANTPEIALLNKSLSTLKSLGATITDPAYFPNYTDYRVRQNSSLILELDFKADVANYFNELTYNPNNIHDLQALINFTMTYPAEDWPDRNVVTWQQAEALPFNQSGSQYYTALETDLYLGSNATILGALENYNLDALVLPTSMSYAVAAIAGYPIVSVPLGYYPPNTTVVWNSRNTLVTAGPMFPIGLAFLGRRFSEVNMVKFACAFQQATNYREERQPYIIPNFQLVDVM